MYGTCQMSEKGCDGTPNLNDPGSHGGIYFKPCGSGYWGGFNGTHCGSHDQSNQEKDVNPLMTGTISGERWFNFSLPAARADATTGQSTYKFDGCPLDWPGTHAKFTCYNWTADNGEGGGWREMPVMDCRPGEKPQQEILSAMMNLTNAILLSHF